MIPRLILTLVLACGLGLRAQENGEKKGNRLAAEKSPYLKQHAGNPVDWWPFGDAAFAEAKRRGLPVLLSIGYSTCHWCHVMEEESFENEEIAALLNESFICIKLDREERPDIDAAYMKVIQAMTGRGGWPATLLLTPDRKAFWAGTYLPPESVRQLAEQVSKLWKEDRAQIEESAQKILSYLLENQKRKIAEKLPRQNLLDEAASQLAKSYDEEHGGFGEAPKFPRVSGLLFLLRSPDERALDMVWQTMKAMAHGGIHDHLGGGLHRYAVDAAWRVPHFEKMLYDQALALEAYIELGTSCDEKRAYGMAEDIVSCLLRDFRSSEGGFYAAFDADSEGKEGAFYVWRMEELKELLEADELKVVLHRFDIRPEGNWPEAEGLEKANVLILKQVFAETAAELELEEKAVVALWRSARAKLFEARRQRVAPLRDDKIITAWNGLTISALARAGRVLDRPEWIDAAIRAADFIEAKLRDEEGRLFRRYIDGEAAHPATLVDHAYLALGLIDLFETTADLRWLDRAEVEAAAILRHHDAASGGFWDSLEDGDLYYRTSDAYDGALPSANGMATLALYRLHAITGKPVYRELADIALRSFGKDLAQHPQGFPVLLRALQLRLEGSRELVVVADPEREDSRELIAQIRRAHLGDTLVLIVRPDQVEALAERVPVVAGRTAGEKGAPLAYYCRDKTCELPVKTWEDLKRAMAP